MPDDTNTPQAQEPDPVLDWRAGPFGTFGIVIVERLNSGAYRIGAVLDTNDVAAFLAEYPSRHR